MLYTVQTIIYAHIKTYVKREKIEECTGTGRRWGEPLPAPDLLPREGGYPDMGSTDC